MREKRRLALLVRLALFLAALVASAAAIAINAATSVQGPWPLGLEELRRHPFLWTAALVPVTGMVAYAAWKLQLHAERQIGESIPPPLPVPAPSDWIARRPDEVSRIVRALCRREARAIALHGAGGFGKTTLAQMVCTHKGIRRRFKGRIYWHRIGPDAVEPEAIARNVNELIGLIGGEASNSADPLQSGQLLGRLLGQLPATLLVLDDIWTPEQLRPFLVGGPRTRRLITTRASAGGLPDATPIPVDRMAHEQARVVLTREVDLRPVTVNRLLALTGRWPLLLRLVNRAIAVEVGVGVTTDTAAKGIEARLRMTGPQAMDDPGAVTALDLNDPDQRSRTVGATIEAGTKFLVGQGAERFAELAIFTPDEAIPRSVVEILWQATANLDSANSRILLTKLADLSLIGIDRADGGSVSLHNAFRDVLHSKLGEARIASLNAVFLDAVATHLTPAAPLVAGTPCAAVTWWELPQHSRYLADRLIGHLIEAGRADEAEALACDIRWVETRLLRFGPVAPQVDLVRLATPQARSMLAVLARSAHLLTPTQPAEAVLDTLHSRIDASPEWGTQVRSIQTTLRRSRLTNGWPLPGRHDPAIVRTLIGHPDQATTVAIAPDGTWLATGGFDDSARIWHPLTGALIQILGSEPTWITAIAIAPDGTWLATGDIHSQVRIWELGTGNLVRLIPRYISPISTLSITPDSDRLSINNHDLIQIRDPVTGTYLPCPRRYARWATSLITRLMGAEAFRPTSSLGPINGPYETMMVAAPDGTWLAARHRRDIQIWDIGPWTVRGTLTGHTETITAMAAAPNSTWLATTSADSTVRIWNPTAATASGTREEHRVTALAVPPSGAGLVTISDSGTVQICDPSTGSALATVPLGGRGTAVVVAPDGTWVGASNRRAVHIWEATGGTRTLAVKVGPNTSDRVTAMAVAPDGTWLATTDDDGALRIWDPTSGTLLRTITSSTNGLTAVAVEPDGTWLAVLGHNNTVQIRDPVSHIPIRTLTGHTSRVTSVAIAPDGTWLATGDLSGTTRIWDSHSGTLRVAFNGHRNPVAALAVAPDGTWLATSNADGTVRIWRPDDGQCSTLIRTDDSLRACTWMPDNTGLILGGKKGLYRFNFHPPT